MVETKTPKQIVGMGLNIAGAILIIVGLVAFGLSVVAGITQQEAIPGMPVITTVASLALIVVGVAFTAASFYSQKIKATQPKKKK